jgi:hypothetical protein
MGNATVLLAVAICGMRIVMMFTYNRPQDWLADVRSGDLRCLPVDLRCAFDECVTEICDVECGCLEGRELVVMRVMLGLGQGDDSV